MTDADVRPSSASRRSLSKGRLVLYSYLVLLATSTVVRWLALPEYTARPGQETVMVNAVVGDSLAPETVALSYFDVRPVERADPPVLVLLHGSPLSSPAMNGLRAALADSFRLIIPDLPGFRGSEIKIPDYSVEAHGHYLVQLLEHLGIANAHLVGYSQGGGVALEAYDAAPGRIASIAMVAAIGVQELELLGNYTMNHAIHGLQLSGLWMVREFVPHFGYFDDAILGVSYARNFYDTDQRPLRGILKRYEAPMLIVHGADDVLVPLAAAEEHARIVPQSQLLILDGGHSLPFSELERLANPIQTFVQAVEGGTAPTRPEALPARIAAAEQPFDPTVRPPATGITLGVLMLLIALSTLVSEDLACIGAGLLVAQGTMTFIPAASGAFIGIFVGDIGLFLAGRYLGRPFVRKAPLKWFIKEADLDRGSKWLAQQGAKVIFASRFVPGSRLPTYVASGMLHTPFWFFTGYFLLASIIWTPILVGLAVWFGNEVLQYLTVYEQYALWVVLGAILVFMVALRVIVPAFTHRGRRLLVGKWRRLTQWEFWPAWFFNIPVVINYLVLALRYRSLTLFANVNPGIEEGGFVGESKADILKQLRGAGEALAQFTLIEPNEALPERVQAVAAFQEAYGFTYPIVLKPDVGQRGSAVTVVRSEAEVETYLRENDGSVIVQEYAAGVEFGVFYYRYPDEAKGCIYSITDKQFPKLIGDGTTTLENLILDDERAVCMAPYYFKLHQDRIFDVPATGEVVQLVEIGTHARGAIFLDGQSIWTPELEAAIDRVSQAFDGFYFGRYDIRTPSVEAFQQGHTFKIVELNGVTSEATHIYDPKNSLWEAYCVLFKQWRIAFEIGAQNRARGVPPVPLRRLLRRLFDFAAS